ncbi:MAG TPA: hypothetical protein VE959_12450 [Bryobacteraceae bacterium]|nr:hypothetical protein [Bryobacteraceae bacterium]
MPETKNYVFEHTELAEILVKNLGIHEGFWGIYIEFGLKGANVPVGPDSRIILPAAISFVQKIGIQRFDEPNSLSVDAALVNPPMAKKKR